MRNDAARVGRCRHPIANVLLHFRKPNPELVLEKLADKPQATVAQMVDIVNFADIVVQVDIITDRRENIGQSYMIGGFALIVADEPESFL